MYPIVKKILLPLCFMAFILASCSSSKNFYLEPEYQANKISSDVTVLPVYRSSFPNFTTHTFGSLSGTGRNVFMTSIESLFSKFTSTSVQSIKNPPKVDVSKFKSSGFKIKENEFDLIVPTENYSPDLNSPRFIVVLDQFYFRKKNRPAVSSSFAGQEQVGQGKILYFETKYAYWDTEKKKIVGWGISSADTNLDQEDPKESDFTKILSEAIEKIVAEGPVKAKP